MNVRLGVLALVGLGGIAVLLFAHARWLTEGPRDPRLVRFLRTYDRREQSRTNLPDHATPLDFRGQPFADEIMLRTNSVSSTAPSTKHQAPGTSPAPGTKHQAPSTSFSPSPAPSTKHQALGTFPIAPSGSALRRVLDDLVVETGEPTVRLSLDARLQMRAVELMKNRFGAVVILEPTNGRLRALVSSPNDAALNRALNGLYPPGSTFKIFLAAAALSADLDPVFNCPAAGWRANRSTPPIRDVEATSARRKGRVWKGFGRLNLENALIHSSNTYFAQLGVAFGPSRFADAVDAAHLRDPIHLPVIAGSVPTSRGSVPASRGSVPTSRGSVPASPGSVPASRGSVPASPGSVPIRAGSVPVGPAGVHAGENEIMLRTKCIESAAGGVPDGLRAVELAPVAIGQGALQLTPLSVALLTAAVANDGVMLAPTLAPEGRASLRGRPFTMAAAQRVKKMMRGVVQRGTGSACDLYGLSVCGKTGTAQTSRGRDHAWFTCFAPYDEPRLVITVLVEHGGFGAEAALPIARSLLLEAKKSGYFR